MNPRIKRALILGVLACAAGAPLVACWGPEFESLRFNSARPDFFRMPQPWLGVPSEKRARSVTAYDENAWRRPSQADAAARNARAAEAAGRFGEAAKLWQEQRRLFTLEIYGAYVGQTPQPLAEGLDDRIAALQQWRGPRDTASLRAYLAARANLMAGTEPVLPLLEPLASTPFAARAAYLRAAYTYYRGHPAKAVDAYRDVTRRFPNDPLAHYMVGRSLFRRVTALYSDLTLREPEPRRMLEEARDAYDRAARLAGASRIGGDAEGMAAACEFRLQRFPEALLRYCRELATLRGAPESQGVWVSAHWSLEKMSAADHQRFQGFRSRRRPRSTWTSTSATAAPGRERSTAWGCSRWTS